MARRRQHQNSTAWISHPERQSDWFLAQSDEALAAWVIDSLSGDTTFPITVSGRGLTTAGALAGFLRFVYTPEGQVDPALRRRAVSAIHRALQTWTRNDDDSSLSLLSGLLDLVGRLDVSAGYDFLVWIAFTRLTSDRPAVHRQLLQVVLGQQALTPMARLLCERDIRDPRYANVCFRALYESTPETFAGYLRILIQHEVARPGLIHLDMCLNYLFETVGTAYVLPRFAQMFRELGPEERRVAFQALYRVAAVDIKSLERYESPSKGRFHVMDHLDSDVYVDLDMDNPQWITEEMTEARKRIAYRRPLDDLFRWLADGPDVGGHNGEVSGTAFGGLR